MQHSGSGEKSISVGVQLLAIAFWSFVRIQTCHQVEQ